MSNLSEYQEEGPHQTTRPRSLYTIHNFYNQTNGNYPVCEAPPAEAWSPCLMSGSTACPVYNSWRQNITAATPPKVFTPNYNDSEEFGREYDDSNNYGSSAIATTHGILSLRLNHGMRVDLTTDQAVRIINFQSNIVIAMNSAGSVVAMLHPNGRVHQYGSRVEIMAHDPRGNHKYAKMWYKGVSFTAENCALVYLVDSAGTRTTTDNFSDLSHDFSASVFYTESKHGSAYVPDAIASLQASYYWLSEENVENWLIAGVRISQSQDGLVRAVRGVNKYQVRTSPVNGTACVTTPYVHCTASMGQTCHLFVRRGERRMHFDGSSFIVRNAGHSAGFDEKTQLKVY